MLTTKLFCGHCGSLMVGESGTSYNGSTYHYYKCANRKRNPTACDKKTERKDWIEEAVVRYTVQTVLTDENIEYIATKAMEILKKEAAENSILPHLRESLRDTTKRIKNLLDMMEQGVSTESTRERLLELESEKKDLIVRIAREENKKPRLTKERIMFWLESFRQGDIDNEDYRRRVIDTLVNSVFVWDTPDSKGRKIVFTFNISGQNTATLNVSDITCFSSPCTSPPPKGGGVFLMHDGLFSLHRMPRMKRWTGIAPLVPDCHPLSAAHKNAATAVRLQQPFLESVSFPIQRTVFLQKDGATC